MDPPDALGGTLPERRTSRLGVLAAGLRAPGRSVVALLRKRRERLDRLALHGLDEEVYRRAAHQSDAGPQVGGIPDLEFILDTAKISVDAGSVKNVPVRLRASEDDLAGRSTPIEFSIAASDDRGLAITERAKFLGPIP